MEGRRRARRSDQWARQHRDSEQLHDQRERIFALNSAAPSTSNSDSTSPFVVSQARPLAQAAAGDTSPLYRPKLSSHSYRAAVGGAIIEKYRYDAMRA